MCAVPVHKRSIVERSLAGPLAPFCVAFQMTGRQQLKRPSVGEKPQEREAAGVAAAKCASSGYLFIYFFLSIVFHRDDESPLLFAARVS